MSPWFPRWKLGTCCLLVETDGGPILVDTGLGLHDHTTPTRLVRFFKLDFGIRCAPEETAACQVTRLGWQPQDIRHIVLSHLHFDHAGGLPDFPWANVHVHRLEYEALLHPEKWIEKYAYDRADFAHQPSWQLYEQHGESWYGFDAIALPFSPEMYLIPLFGHTSGHCGLAIRDGSGWMFYCADALPTGARFDLTPGWLNRMVIGPHVPRLKAFGAAHPEVRMVAGHMFIQFFNREGLAAASG